MFASTFKMGLKDQRDRFWKFDGTARDCWCLFKLQGEIVNSLKESWDPSVSSIGIGFPRSDCTAYLANWLAGWLADWLTDWLTDWKSHKWFFVSEQWWQNDRNAGQLFASFITKFLVYDRYSRQITNCDSQCNSSHRRNRLCWVMLSCVQIRKVSVEKSLTTSNVSLEIRWSHKLNEGLGRVGYQYLTGSKRSPAHFWLPWVELAKKPSKRDINNCLKRYSWMMYFSWIYESGQLRSSIDDYGLELLK
jgi:hypothetical protein